MIDIQVPFNRPYISAQEIKFLQMVLESGHMSGDGPFTKLCNQWFKDNLKSTALLTHSCTAALEMAAILANVGPGDEIIMPSYTFVSTANAFVLRGATPVFIDIRPDTLNINEKLIESAITPKTKVIVPVHYAGVACEMDAIMEIAEKYNLIVIEDAAQGIMASYKGRALGTIGHFGTYSFHETKNIISGEGGALLVNDLSYFERAEIIREKGTNRNKFFRGEVDKYTWVDIGSSFLPSEIIAALLWSQLQNAREITDNRLKIWSHYHHGLEKAEINGLLRRPKMLDSCTHNAHMYFVLLSSLQRRSDLIEYLRTNGVRSVFHYVPLHSSPAGKKFGRVHGEMKVTNDISERLLRLPMWVNLSTDQIDQIISLIVSF